MKQALLQEKYPIFVTEIGKHETVYRSVDELAAYYQACIVDHPKAHFISVFDHYAHTRKIDGPIVAGMTAAVEVVFCFGFAIPSPEMLAVRPRSIGIADMGETFVISFMEAPMPVANDTMTAWTRAVRKA